MAVPERLAACAGAWTGPSALILDPDSEQRDTSASAATLAPVANGKFLRLDYDWSFEGARQEGSLLIGGDPAGVVTGHWVDSFHMGDGLLVCGGTVTSGGGISVLGSYPAPSGPDWGWRILLEPDGGDGLLLAMYNIEPDGPEELAVEARYRRS